MLRLFLALLVTATVALNAPAQASLAAFDRVEALSAYDRDGIHHAICKGKVIDTEGEPIGGARIILYGYQPYYWALPIANTLTDEDGTFTLLDVSGSGELALWVLSPESEPFATNVLGLILVSGRTTELRPITVFANDVDTQLEPLVVKGVVRGSDGSPIRGSYVRLGVSEGAFDPGGFAITATDGSFEILSHIGSPAKLDVFLQSRRVTIEHTANEAELSRADNAWHLDLSKDLVIQHEDFESFELSAQGLAGSKAIYSFERGGTWYPYANNKVFLVRFKYGSGSGWIRASATGYLPIVQTAPRERVFDFGDAVSMKLRVRGDDGTPISNAWIDVCLPEDDDRSELQIATYRTDETGAIEVLGSADMHYPVYVYATGFGAIREEWQGESVLELRLPAESAQLKFVVEGENQTIYVRRAGSLSAEAVIKPNPRIASFIALPPNRYEFLRYDETGSLVGAETVELERGEILEPALDRDDRPTVTLKLPDLGNASDWWVYASRAAVGGMVANWMAFSGGERAKLIVPVETNRVEGPENTFRMRFPTSGRYTLLVGHKDFQHRIFRDVDVAFGASLELEMPKLDAKVKGSVGRFPRRWASAFGPHHGIAGPRLALLPDPVAGSPWGILVPLPEREFLLDRIPAGSFVLHHHLYATGILASENGTYGGTALTVASGQTTDAGELGRGSSRRLEVKIVDQGGNSLSGTLQIRDRMYESWAKVVEEGTTLRMAEAPIPTPPSVRLIAGKAKMRQVRKGRIAFVLTLADGRKIHFKRDVTPGETNLIELELAKGR